MPELPEVETLRRGLQAHLLDQRIVAVAVANPKILKGQSEAELRDCTVGRRVLCADRRGKHLLIPLSSPSPSETSWTLYVHLNMRGSLRLAMDQAEDTGRHLCLTLSFESGVQLRYHDTWGWGEVQAVAGGTVETGGTVEKRVAGLGPDALTEDGGGTALLKRIGGRRSPIKAVLLDQSVLAGVGNIYADEALHRAGIHPCRAAADLSEGEGERLAMQVRLVLEEATAQGGSQGEFTDLWGKTGRYVPRVYDRGGQPCPSCGQALEKIRLGGRGTTFCPLCQK